MKYLLIVFLIGGLANRPDSAGPDQSGIEKAYAYQRPRYGGAAPKPPASENGQLKMTPATNPVQWLVYAVCVNDQVKPVRIWLEGVPYSVECLPVETPVIARQESLGNQVSADTLVPPSVFPVLQILPKQAIITKNKRPGSDKRAPVVIDYYYAGNMQHTTVHEYKKLPALVLQ